MALARVQASAKHTSGNTTSVVITFSTRPTVGNALVVLVNGWGTTAAAITGVDNNSNAYTNVASQQNGIIGTAVVVCPLLTATAGGAAFQVTLSQGANMYWVAQAVEVSGVGTGLVVDQIAGATGNSASPATGATAALTGAEVVQAACHAIMAAQASITVVSATPTWTQEFEELPFSFIAGEADTRVVTAATGTTPSCSWTDTASNIWTAVLVAFTAGGAAAVATADSYVWGPL